MCCFLVPMAQAVATTIYRKSIESHNTGSGTAAFVKSKVNGGFLKGTAYCGTANVLGAHLLLVGP